MQRPSKGREHGQVKGAPESQYDWRSKWSKMRPGGWARARPPGTG